MANTSIIFSGPVRLFTATIIAASFINFDSGHGIAGTNISNQNKPSRGEEIRHHLDRGAQLEREGLFPEAIKAYEQSMNLSGKLAASPIIYLRLATCYERMSQYKTALRYYNEALGRGAVHQEMYLGRGNVLEKLNQWKRAEKDYAEAVNLNPQNGESRGRLGRAKLRGGRAKASLKDLLKADVLLPGQGWIYYETAIALYRLDRISESAEYLKKSLATGYDPPEPEWAAVILSANAPTGRFESSSERNP